MPTNSCLNVSLKKHADVSSSYWRVFVGPGSHPGWRAGGNPCLVVTGNERLETSPAVSINTSNQLTHCTYWQQYENILQVRCMAASGILIECCGHGLIAAAASWFKQHGCKSLTLEMNGSQVPCFKEKDEVWLSFTRIQAQACSVPEWVGQFFSELPESAAYAGEESGYLILQWRQNFPLESLSPPTPELGKFTGRGIIVTVRITETLSPWQEQIRFRYFAPQYGVTEDAATGSAMRILMDYWYRQARLEQLTAYQCSGSGGVLHSKLRDDKVMVGGLVAEQQVLGEKTVL